MATSRDGRRWMGVGQSGLRDTRAAATAAGRAALLGTDPKLAVVFAGIDHDPAAIGAGLRTVVGDTPVVGCSTHGEIGPNGALDDTVVVAMIGGVGFSVSTAVARHVSGRQRDAGAEVADRKSVV